MRPRLTSSECHRTRAWLDRFGLGEPGRFSPTGTSTKNGYHVWDLAVATPFDLGRRSAARRKREDVYFTRQSRPTPKLGVLGGGNRRRLG